MTETEKHPVQANMGDRHKQAYAPKSVTMRAYEVCCKVYGEQEAMVTGGCRGGFSTGELIGFLYARSFPETEWDRRVKEFFRGSENIV
jgi:hypothetical protein